MTPTANTTEKEHFMTNNPLIPVTGYVAWYAGADDYDVTGFPVVGLVEHAVSYDGETVETEFQPAIIDRMGSLRELHEDQGQADSYFIGGHLIGITPASMGAQEALEFLARFQVPLDPHNPDSDDELGTPLQRAQRQARGQYTWGRVAEACAPHATA